MKMEWELVQGARFLFFLTFYYFAIGVYISFFHLSDEFDLLAKFFSWNIYNDVE